MKKFFKILYYAIFIFLVAVALLLIFSFFPITGNYKFLTVLSGSMEPTIKTGSVIVVKPVNNYKIGDVVTFGKATKTETPITHRIFDIRIEEGNPIYITKGDANKEPDTKEVSKDEIIGKVLFDAPYLGYAVDTAKKPIGFLVIIIVPSIIIISDELKKIWDEVKKLKNEKKDKEQDKKIKKLKQEIDDLRRNVAEAAQDEKPNPPINKNVENNDRNTPDKEL